MHVWGLLCMNAYRARVMTNCREEVLKTVKVSELCKAMNRYREGTCRWAAGGGGNKRAGSATQAGALAAWQNACKVHAAGYLPGEQGAHPVHMHPKCWQQAGTSLLAQLSSRVVGLPPPKAWSQPPCLRRGRKRWHDFAALCIAGMPMTVTTLLAAAAAAASLALV
jgi:hypothetical protein